MQLINVFFFKSWILVFGLCTYHRQENIELAAVMFKNDVFYDYSFKSKIPHPLLKKHNNDKIKNDII